MTGPDTPMSGPGHFHAVTSPRQLNALRQKALARFSAKEQKQLSLRRHLCARAGDGGAELRLDVGTAPGAKATTSAEVVALLNGLAERDVPVRCLKRRGHDNWRGADVGRLARCPGANTLHSLSLGAVHLDAGGVGKLGGGHLTGLRSLQLYDKRGLDAQLLDALAGGAWPELRALSLGNLRCGPETLLVLCDAMPELRSLSFRWELHAAPDGDYFHALFTDPRFARIRELRLGEARGASLLPALSAAGGLHLETLEVTSCMLEGAPLETYLATPQAQLLCTLEGLTLVPDNARLFVARPLDSLKRLRVTLAGVDDAGLLRGVLPPGLEALELARYETAPAGVVPRALEALTSLQHLTLVEHTQTELDSVDAIVACASRERLRSVAIRAPLTSGSVKKLAHVMFEALVSLELPADDLASIAVVDAAWARNLHTLTLRDGTLSDAFAEHFSTLSFDELGTLDLSNNDIRQAGALALAQSSGLPQLHTLALGGNPSCIYGGNDHAAYKRWANLKAHPNLQSLTLPTPTTNTRQGNALATNPSAFVSTT